MRDALESLMSTSRYRGPETVRHLVDLSGAVLIGCLVVTLRLADHGLMEGAEAGRSKANSFAAF